MKRQFTLASIFLLSLAMTSAASADLIVDFTATGADAGNEVNATSFVYSSQDPSGTGVSFDLTATIVVAPMGQQNTSGLLADFNGGLGSEVENTGAFLNNINDIPEIIRFTVSNVTGLAAGDNIVLADLLSQNSSSTAADQSGGYGGTFGQQAADSVTLTSDLGPTFVINQSDGGDTGSILLNGDAGNTGNTGNTFAHSANSFEFTNSFDLRLTDLTANEAIVIQGFEFNVVSAIPEPTSASLLGFVGLLTLVRRRKQNLA